MKLFKKFLFLMLSCALITESFVETTIVKAETSSHYSLETYLSEEAINLGKDMLPDCSLSVSQIRILNDIVTNKIEYMVSYCSDNVPYGYVVFCLNGEEFVPKEISIEKGASNPYDEIVEKVEENENVAEIDEALVEIGVSEYGVVGTTDEGQDELYDEKGKKIENVDLDGESYNNNRSIYIASKNWYPSKYQVNNSSKVSLKCYENKARLMSESDIEKLTSKYCCAVQAIHQIAYMQNVIGSSDAALRDAYNNLWLRAKVKQIDKENGISYGAAKTDDATSALVNYLKVHGYKSTSKTGLKSNPSYTWLSDNIKNNHPIYYRYGLRIKGQLKIPYHAISVLGCMKAKKVSSGNTYHYIKVYNGWDNTPSYINYDLVDFVEPKACAFTIKK